MLCEVVEVVVLGSGEAWITDEAVQVRVFVLARDLFIPSAAVAVGDVAIATAFSEGDVALLADTKAVARNEVALSFDRLIPVFAYAYGDVYVSQVEELAVSVEAAVYVEGSLAVGVFEYLRGSDSTNALVSVFREVMEHVRVGDYADSVEDVEVAATVQVFDAVELSFSVGVAVSSPSTSSLELSVEAFGAALVAVSAKDVYRFVVAATVIEVVQVQAEAISYLGLSVSDQALSTIQLVGGVTSTQELIAQILVSSQAVADHRVFAASTVAVSDILESTVRSSGLGSSAATVLDQQTVGIDLGSHVYDSCRAVEVLYIDIEAQLVTQVFVNDQHVLGVELVAEEMVGGIAALGRTIGTVAIHASFFEQVDVAVLVDPLVGFDGAVELNVVDNIVVYDRLEVVGGLDSFAWVLNSQSMAHSYYDGFVDFNSAVQVGKRVFLLSSSGLYELGGDSDDGKIIEAEVVTGQMDFGTIDRKRVEQFDLGYTAAGDLQAVVSCEGFEPSEPQTLEAREMRTAHTSRIRVGKGMVGRYWKLELKNREGADFELFSIQTKAALSTRRMR